MRVTSHCATHPSREATVRCRSCRTWLCELCVRRYGGFVYCDRLCHLRGLLVGASGSVLQAARRRLHPAWVTVLVAAVVAAAGIPVVRLSAVLLEEAAAGRDEPFPVSLTAEPGQPGSSDLVLTGPAGAGVLVVSDGEPLEVLRLDGAGRGRLDLTGLEGGGEALELILLPTSPLRIELPEHLARAAPGASPSPASTTRITVPPLQRPSTPDVVAPDPTFARLEAPPDAPVDEPARPITRSPPRRPDSRTPPVLHLVTDAGPRLALTFDGDTVVRGASELLELLEELDLRVTLFVSGRFIERQPALIRRAVLTGHEIGNHTYAHPHLTTYASNRRHDMRPGVTRERFIDELRRTEEVFRHATGRAMAPLWRAPYGEENGTLRRWALEEGYLHVRWSSLGGASLDSHDWVDDEHSPLYRDPDRMARRLLRFPRLEGGIALMHLGSERPTPPWTALPGLVENLRARGIQIVPVTDMLQASSIWRPWLERARRHRPTVAQEASDQSRSSTSGSASRR